MLTVMTKCPITERTISTGIRLGGSSWNRKPKFFAYTRLNSSLIHVVLYAASTMNGQRKTCGFPTLCVKLRRTLHDRST